MLSNTKYYVISNHVFSTLRALMWTWEGIVVGKAHGVGGEDGNAGGGPALQRREDGVLDTKNGDGISVGDDGVQFLRRIEVRFDSLLHMFKENYTQILIQLKKEANEGLGAYGAHEFP